MLQDILQQLKDCIVEIEPIWPRRRDNDPFIFQIQLLSKAGKLPKLAALEEYLWKNGLRALDKSRQKPGLSVPYIMINPAYGIIQSIFEETGSLDVNSPEAQIVVQNYVNSLASLDAEYISFAPLFGFTTTIEKIDLWADYSIRKLSPSEFSRCQRIFGRFRNVSENTFFLVTAPYKCALDNDPGKLSISNDMDRILKFLRLVRTGYVDFFDVHTMCIHPGWISSPSSTLQVRAIRPDYTPTSSYEFLQTDKEILETLHKAEGFYEIEGKDKAQKEFFGRLKIAISRIQRTNQRLSPSADDIVDLMIALEALVGEKGEAIAYKLGMRTAKLCGVDAADRLRIYQGVKSAYGRRSSIVHGDAKKPELDGYLTFSHTVVRQVLIQLLRDLVTGKIWTLEALDANILS